jgi:uncharacterized repeat protein (TIGR01451 family)
LAYLNEGTYAGGAGATVEATVPVTPGTALSVFVGGAGGSENDASANETLGGSNGGAGGFGGGGGGGDFGAYEYAGGGGASVVASASGVPLVVAGGGGGAGDGDGGSGGLLGGSGGSATDGGVGGTAAGDGGSGPSGGWAFGGGGGGGVGSGAAGGPGSSPGGSSGGGNGSGTIGGGGGAGGILDAAGDGGVGGSGQAAAGLGNQGGGNGGNGSGSGGNGGTAEDSGASGGGGGAGGIGFGGGGGGANGAGGGGGYGGGGGGTGGGGGGGGSSYVISSATATSSSATNTGNGSIVITYDPAADACPTPTLSLTDPSGKPLPGNNTYDVTLGVPSGAPAPSEAVVVSDGSTSCDATLSNPSSDEMTYTGSCTLDGEVSGAVVTATYDADAKDPNYLEATATPTLTVAYVVTVTNPGNQTNSVGDSVTLPISATDSGGANLGYGASDLPAGLSIDASSGIITGSPTKPGTSDVLITVTDSHSVSAEVSFTWTINSKPALAITDIDNDGGSSISTTEGTAAPGSSIVYTVSVSNTGTATATDVAVTETLPSQGLSNVTSPSLPTGVTFNAVTDTWTISSLASGATDELTLTGTVPADATGIYTDAVAASATDASPATATDSDALTPEAYLTITKTDNDGGTVTPGGAITYKIAVTNVGPSNATDVTVVDDLPSQGLSGPLIDDGGTVDATNGTVTWILGTLASGASATLTLTGTVPASATGKTYTNEVAASATDASGVTAADADTLSVPEVAPTITSPASAAFTAGKPGTFAVTTAGTPGGSSMVITESGMLPGGVTFSNDDNGMATLAGTPQQGSRGNYPITITAANGVSPSAVQHFVLTVQAPTTLHVIVGPGPGQVGSPLVAIAVVSSLGPLSGTVSFSASYDGGPAAALSKCQNLSTVVNLAVCAFTPANPPGPGSYVISATYSGDSLDTGSAGSSMPVPVRQPTTLTLTPPPSAHHGSPITLSAKVSPTPDSGTVTFSVSGPSGARVSLPAACVAAKVAGGTATCTFTPIQGGTYSVSSQYSGDALYDPSSATLRFSAT